MNLFLNVYFFQRPDMNSTWTEWNVSGSLVQQTEVDEKETLCTPENQIINIFVSQKFRYFNYTEGVTMSLLNAMDTCTKLGRAGANLTEITSKEQFKIWHKQGNNNKVKSKTYHTFHWFTRNFVYI